MKNLEQRKLHKLSGQCVSFRRPCYLVLKFVAGANSSGVRPEALRPNLSVGLPFSEPISGFGHQYRASAVPIDPTKNMHVNLKLMSTCFRIHGFDVQICEEGPTKIVAS